MNNKNNPKPIFSTNSGALDIRLEKIGVREFDLRDRYHLALAIT